MNLYTVYTKEEVEIFNSLSSIKDSISPTSKLIEISSKIPIFDGIPKTVLVKILKDIRIMKYKKGEVIIREKEKDDRIFYILLGEVYVIKRNIVITTLGAHSIVGEMAGLLNQYRTASIISSNNATTIISFKIDFRLMHTDLGFYFATIYKNLSIELAKKLLKQDDQIIKK